jgi:Fuc2NAc and GlcNAc transferase
LTLLMRRYALAAQLLDVPNARSSHTTPTPRGGGLAIVAVVLVGLPILSLTNDLGLAPMLALWLGGAGVAAVGWLDDRLDVAAHWRLLVHLAAASLLLVLAGGAPALSLPWVHWSWGLFGSVILVLLTTWILNLFNFMDGIDGIAGVEVVSVAGVAAALLWWLGAPGWAAVSALVALASAGFLLLNWPPASIFMGDAGSGFLGFTLAALLLLTWVATPLSLWTWLILLGVFIVDATVTLLRRALRAERVHEAHRSHAYQHAARRLKAHRPVTVAVMLINLLWLTPWAVMTLIWPDLGIVFLAVAWLPLVLVCLHLRAGLPE